MGGVIVAGEAQKMLGSRDTSGERHGERVGGIATVWEARGRSGRLGGSVVRYTVMVSNEENEQGYLMTEL